MLLIYQQKFTLNEARWCFKRWRCGWWANVWNLLLQQVIDVSEWSRHSEFVREESCFYSEENLRSSFKLKEKIIIYSDLSSHRIAPSNGALQKAVSQRFLPGPRSLFGIEFCVSEGFPSTLFKHGVRFFHPKLSYIQKQYSAMLNAIFGGTEKSLFFCLFISNKCNNRLPGRAIWVVGWMWICCQKELVVLSQISLCFHLHWPPPPHLPPCMLMQSMQSWVRQNGSGKQRELYSSECSIVVLKEWIMWIKTDL